MIPVMKVLKKDTCILSILAFYENINKIVFKVLSSTFWCIMDNYVCVYYLSCLQTKLCVTSKGQWFENRTYNSVSRYYIPELLIESFHLMDLRTITSQQSSCHTVTNWLIIIFKLVFTSWKILCLYMWKK